MIKEIKVEKLIQFLIFLLLWILTAYNTKTTDINSYHMFYEYAQNGIRYANIEYGYYLFMRICVLAKFDFDSFLKLYSFIVLLIVYKSLNLYLKKNRVLTLILLLYFPFLHIFAALRNYMSWALIVFSIRYLIYDYKNRKVKYILCIICASLFHTSSLYCLIFLLADLELNNVYKLSLLFSIVFLILIMFSTRFSEFVSAFNNKLSLYLFNGIQGTRNETKLFLLLYYLAKFFFCVYLNNDISYDNNILRNINMLTITIFPFAITNMNFMRIEYNLILFFSIFVFNTCSIINTKKTRNCKILYIIFYLISGYILLYLFSFESVVKTVWMNNKFLEIFIK